MAKKLIRELFHIIFYIFLIVLTSYLISHFIVQRTNVIGISMENTLMDKDNLIIDRFGYYIKKPKRFDIIVFPIDGMNYIKRIIGLPGETVQIIDGFIYINGKVLDENYGKEAIKSGYEGLASEQIVIGAKEYFVLGDNRNHSTDSRDETVGNVPKSKIIGKASFRIWPTNKIGALR